MEGRDMTPDEFGTDRESLVGVNLDPEPADYSEPEEAGADEVAAPEANIGDGPVDVSDDPLGDDDFDAAGDLAWLRSGGDRG
jgi:hypothetical protein